MIKILPKSIFLIRHGESKGNVDHKLYDTVPDWKISLTAKGRKQAKETGQLLAKKVHGSLYPSYASRPDIIVYASPWCRASETAQIIRKELEKKKYMLKYYEDPRLREQEWGSFQPYNRMKMQRERYKYGTFFYRIPNGESGADVYDRVTTFFDTMYRDFRNTVPTDIIIVSHGLTIKAFLMRWFHLSVEEFEEIKTPTNCQIIEMVNDKGRFKLKTKLRRRK